MCFRVDLLGESDYGFEVDIDFLLLDEREERSDDPEMNRRRQRPGIAEIGEVGGLYAPWELVQKRCRTLRMDDGVGGKWARGIGADRRVNRKY